MASRPPDLTTHAARVAKVPGFQPPSTLSEMVADAEAAGELGDTVAAALSGTDPRESSILVAMEVLMHETWPRPAREEAVATLLGVRVDDFRAASREERRGFCDCAPPDRRLAPDFLRNLPGTQDLF